MKEIYYPEFEMRSSTMLYQTILLKEQMNFIIPNSYDREISRNFRKVEEIGVFKRYRVEENYGIIEKASSNFLSFIERIIEYEKLNNIVFTPKSDDYIIVSEKTPYDFPKKVSEIAFGTKENNGIRMNKNFAELYMNYLTDEIVDAENYAKTTNFSSERTVQSLLMRLYNLSEDNILIRTRVQELVYSMMIPSDIYKYRIEDIIEIRTSPNYEKAVIKFNEVIEKSILNFGENNQPLDMNLFREYDNKIEECRYIMGDEIKKVLGKVVFKSIPIVLGCLTSNIPAALAAEFVSDASLSFIKAKREKTEYTFTERAATRKIINRIRQPLRTN